MMSHFLDGGHDVIASISASCSIGRRYAERASGLSAVPELVIRAMLILHPSRYLLLV